MAPGLPAAQQYANGALNTLPDPRSPIPSPDIPRSDSSSPQHPELSNEVATLSNKLIHAINHQTDLDDTLNETRHELDAAHERIQQLEHASQEHNSLVNNGILIRRADVEADTVRLKTALAEERKAKFQTEKEKKAMEQELESLTTALFEEANQMVASARKDAKKEREGIERRNEQLQSQLNDAELLLASHQEQLAELKSAMQQQRNDNETYTNASSSPSTPIVDSNEHLTKVLEGLSISPSTPAPPTSFSGLLHPVLRTDVQSYEDFHALLEVSRKSQPSSRVNSASYSGITGLGLANVSHRESSQVFSRMGSNASTSSLSASNNYPPSPGTPNLPHSNNSSVSSREVPMTVAPLKETPFYKRILTEDLEPTLRLDLAPGLSWLARRGVISAMSEGKLVVEPMPNTSRLYQPPCSLCGEQGRGEKRARKHKFRTSESENAQRYPLCDYCLSRVRASCDFLGFLRMIRDGHWRTDGTEAETAAWEESVRLRERMFWSRIGGGVIPAFLKPREEPPRRSEEAEKGSPAVPSPLFGHSDQHTKPEQPSPLTHEPPVETFQPGFDVSSPIDPKGGRGEEKLESSNSVRPEKRETPQKPVQESPELSRTASSLTRSVTRSRGSSRAEPTGRPSTAQTVAQRAAMFDRRSSDDAAAANQLQNSLQASLKSSAKGRPSSKSRSKSPGSSANTATTTNDESQAPPQMPKDQHTDSEAASVPGAFNF